MQIPTTQFGSSQHGLSPGAIKMLRHFKDENFRQAAYELPGKLSALFGDDAEACEDAQAELSGKGFLDLGPEMPSYFPDRIRAAALSLDGVRFLAKNPLD
jgi:hypothetical protein